MNNTEKIQLFSNKKSNGNENYSKRMIVTKIINCVDDLFDIEVLDYDVTFSEYGIESVSIPLFVEKLKREFNINLTPADMFTYFTVSLLSNYIDSLINTVESEISLDNSILEQPKDKIAIVGISGRFPGGANTIDEFWDLLIHGVDGVGNIPNSRWDVEKYYDEDKSVP
ncbi:MAG: hypothetical protein K0S61_3278, partial [Anaerocolumna sp.]|nr:hypothetical protein [Anaerocolumna sp.]